jgi:hypothetical protein
MALSALKFCPHCRLISILSLSSGQIALNTTTTQMVCVIKELKADLGDLETIITSGKLFRVSPLLERR